MCVCSGALRRRQQDEINESGGEIVAAMLVVVVMSILECETLQLCYGAKIFESRIIIAFTDQMYVDIGLINWHRARQVH